MLLALAAAIVLILSGSLWLLASNGDERPFEPSSGQESLSDTVDSGKGAMESPAAMQPESIIEPGEELVRSGHERTSVRLRVVNETGVGLGGAQVILYETPALISENSLSGPIDSQFGHLSVSARATSNGDGVAVLETFDRLRFVVLFVRAKGYVMRGRAYEFELSRPAHDLGEFEVTAGRKLVVQLTSDSGARIAHGKVLVYADPVNVPGTQNAQTCAVDPSGIAIFESLPRSRLRVTAQAQRHAPSTERVVQIWEGEQDPIVIQLNSGRETSVSVLDRVQRTPIMGAEVYLFLGTRIPIAPDELDAESLAFQGVTDSTGKLSLAGLLGNRNLILARHQGSWVSVQHRGYSSLTLLWSPLIKLRGTATLAGGYSAIGAQVGVVHTERPWERLTRSEVEDGSGRFELELPAGSYDLAIVHEQGSWFSEGSIPVDEARDLGELRLVSGRPIEVSVLEQESRQPIKGAAVDVILHVPGEPDREVRSPVDRMWFAQNWVRATESKTGRFRFTHLRPGMGALRVYHKDYFAQYEPLVPALFQRQSIEVELAQRLSIRLIVQNEAGSPIAGLRLILRAHTESAASAYSHAQSQLSSVSDSSGEARFHRCYPGEWDVLLYGHDLDKLQTIQVREGESEFQITAPRLGSLEVQVLGMQGLIAESEVSVRKVLSGDLDERQLSAISISGQTDSEGRWRVDDLPSGEYLLTAKAPGSFPFAEMIHVAEGENLQQVELASSFLAGRIEPRISGVTVAIGRVKDSTESEADLMDECLSVANARRVNIGSRNAGLEWLTVATQADGSFSVQGCRPGSYYLLAFGNGVIPGPPVVIRLEDVPVEGLVVPSELAGQLTVRVHGFDKLNEAWLGATLRVFAKEETGVTLMPAPSSLGADGDLYFGSLRPGRSTLHFQVHKQGREPIWKELSVECLPGISSEESVDLMELLSKS